YLDVSFHAGRHRWQGQELDARHVLRFQSQDAGGRLEIQCADRPQSRHSRLQTLVGRTEPGELRDEKETAGTVAGTRWRGPPAVAVLLTPGPPPGRFIPKCTKLPLPITCPAARAPGAGSGR